MRINDVIYTFHFSSSRHLLCPSLTGTASVPATYKSEYTNCLKKYAFTSPALYGPVTVPVRRMTTPAPSASGAATA